MSLKLTWMLRNVIGFALLGVILFASSGRLDWVMAWVYLGVNLPYIVSQPFLDPGLIAERSSLKSALQKGAKKWDLFLAIPMGSGLPLAAVVVAGLDMRFEWPGWIPLVLQIAGLPVLALGYVLIIWSMLVNKFFSTIIRIQSDREHRVITGGPYRYVRHPGYVGVVAALAVAPPLVLGSLWAFIPAGLVVVVSVIRTALEDRTLQAELEGYTEYAMQVKYRLLPGIW